METVMEFANYFSDVKNGCTAENALDYWQMREATSPTLAPLASVLLQHQHLTHIANVDSVCGYLTSGKRNRISASLEQHVLLQMKKKFPTALNSINC